MAHAQWPLQLHRQSIQVVLTLLHGRQPLIRTLLADSGAGSGRFGVQPVLEEDDDSSKSRDRVQKQQLEKSMFFCQV